MENVRYTLRDILSRIPGLQEIYQRTLNEPANVEGIEVYSPGPADAFWQMRIEDREVFCDRASLADLVKMLRARFPVLVGLRVVEAGRALDKSVVLFANVPVPEGELDDKHLLEIGTGFVAIDRPGEDRAIPRVPILDVIGRESGSFDGATHSLISPHGGAYASRHSLHYLGMFLLSSLVRYRPQIWMHAISRAANSERPADDQALTLLTEFMSIHSAQFPVLVADTLDP